RDARPTAGEQAGGEREGRGLMARRKARPTSVISFTTGRDARATNQPYPHRAPVLPLDCGATSVLVTTSPPGPVTADAGTVGRPATSPTRWNAGFTPRPTLGGRRPDTRGGAAGSAHFRRPLRSP